MPGADLKTIQDPLGHASVVLTADIHPSVLPEFPRRLNGVGHQANMLR